MVAICLGLNVLINLNQEAIILNEMIIKDWMVLVILPETWEFGIELQVSLIDVDAVALNLHSRTLDGPVLKEDKDTWSLQWCHHEPDGISNHWRLDCLLKRSGAD